MSPKNKKPRYPFMVFRGSIKLPDGRDPFTVLNDSNVPAQDKAKVRTWLNSERDAALDVAASTARRDTQRDRHKDEHELRAKGLALMVWNPVTNRPQRGQPKIVAGKLGVPLATVQGWIEQHDKEQRRARPKRGATDWRAVYHGQALRAWHLRNLKRKR